MEKAGMNPWLKVWTEPGKVIKAMTAHPNHRMPIIAGLYGIPVMLQLAANLGMGRTSSSLMILAASIVLGVLIGYVGIYIMSGLLHMVGRWFGSKGSFNNIRTAVMWSTVPNAVTIICWILLMFTYGSAVFMPGFPRFAMMGGVGSLIPILSIIQLAASIWQLVILVKGISVVQNFSIGKAIGVLVVFLVIVIVIAVLVGVLAGAIAMASMSK